MKKKPLRRTQRSEGLVLTSWVGLSEYLKSAPQDILNIRFNPSERKRLDKLLAQYPGNHPLQEDDSEVSFAADVRVNALDEEQFLSEVQGNPADHFIVACDHVTDTRNLGAIARTCAYFGVRYLLLPKDRQAPITSATLGAAQGAFAHVKPVIVTNLSRMLKILQGEAYWLICADMDGVPVSHIKQHYEKKVLILGSEDRGVSQNLRKHCDLTVCVDAESPQLESLNVSVAAGILIHALHVPSALSKKK